MFAEALSALTINSTNVSLQEYQKVIANQPTYKIEKSKDTYLHLSENDKTEISNDLLILINVYKEFIPINEQAFINNFNNWEINESSNILFLVNSLINESRNLNKEYLKFKKIVKGYSSLSSKLDKLIDLNNNIIKFTNQYLTRAKEADEASKFINSFISNNQEVLKALA